MSAAVATSLILVGCPTAHREGPPDVDPFDPGADGNDVGNADSEPPSDTPNAEIVPLDAGLPEVCEGATEVDWVTMPGGTFPMGQDNSNGGELPIHDVTVPTFQVARTELTACQWWAAMARKGHVPFEPPKLPYDRPVVGVDWGSAKAACYWVDGRLCSEAEWEYAARNGTAATTYPWGESEPTPDQAVVLYVWHPMGEELLMAARPCSKPAGNSLAGLCDLPGNVGEWVEDDVHFTYDGAPTDGSAWVENPRTDYRIVRGDGNWTCCDYTQSGAYRGGGMVGGYDNATGVRCCRSP